MEEIEQNIVEQQKEEKSIKELFSEYDEIQEPTKKTQFRNELILKYLDLQNQVFSLTQEKQESTQIPLMRKRIKILEETKETSELIFTFLKGELNGGVSQPVKQPVKQVDPPVKKEQPVKGFPTKNLIPRKN